MIQLEHLNLVVTDIEQSLKFYGAAFPHWQIRDRGEGDWYGQPYHWLHFGDDYNYLTFNDNGEGENRDLRGQQVGLAHFGFVTQNLDRLIERLSRAGFAIDDPGAEHPYRRNVYYIDPNGFEIEFVEYSSDLPYERNQSERTLKNNTVVGGSKPI